MNKNFSGAVLLLVLALAGLHLGNDFAWMAVAVTAALAFIAEELRDYAAMNDVVFPALSSLVAGASWGAVITAFVSFFV